MAPKQRNLSSYTARKKQMMRLACVILIIIALLVGGYIIGRRLEANSAPEEPKGDLTNRFMDMPRITYAGKEYQQSNRLTSILLLGVDTWAEDSAAVSSVRNGGQSDFLLLLVIDRDQKIVTPIQIDRDTMTEITILGVLGNVAGTRNAQICLSHGFGDGGAQSSLFTVDAVSKLLLGVPIDFYIAMQMDGIAAMNDALGGVTVTLEDDFTSLDAAMARGTTLTLRGAQAEYYTRHRMNIGIGTNESRMRRQQTYMQTATEIFDRKLQEDSNFVGAVFDTLEPYLETSMKRGRMINEAWNTRKYQRMPTLQLAGEHTVGEDGFIEFHADEQALIEMVLRLFYQENMK